MQLALKRGMERLTLLSFTLFLVLGNVPRVIATPLFSDHLLISEAVLYFLSWTCLCLLRPLSQRACLGLLLVAGALLLSFGYGCLLHGFDLHAALYASRLLLLYGTSLVIASLCFQRAQGLVPFLSFFLKIYTMTLALSILIFALFPSSEQLWGVLSTYHVLFHGDPHVGRFVSVYFDPNYYAAIAGMPLLISFFLYEETKKRKYLLLSSLFFLSILLSWSRSGVFVTLAWLLSLFLLSHLRTKTPQSKGFLLVKLLLCFLSFLSFFSEEGQAFWSRTLFWLSDDSALARLHTFQRGIELFLESPLFGVGINFLYPIAKEEIGLASLDSSLLSLLVQVGAVPFLFLLGCALYQIKTLKRLWLLWRQCSSSLFFPGIVFYGFWMVFFASQFNQLLFYPFWLLPFLVLFLFIQKTLEEIHEDKKKKQQENPAAPDRKK